MQGMKLMSPAEARAGAQNQEVQKAARNKELDEVLINKSKQIAQAEADFNSLLASQRLRWAKEEGEHADDIQRRDIEVAALEERKRFALIPIEERERQVENREREAAAEKEKALEKQAECDKTLEVLEVRLDEVGSQREELAAFANRLHSKQLGIDAQDVQTKENARRVSEAMEQLRVESVKFEKYRKEQEEHIFLRKAAVVSQEMEVHKREDKVRLDERNLRSRYAQLGKTEERIKNGQR